MVPVVTSSSSRTLRTRGEVPESNKQHTNYYAFGTVN